jgi:hypothetical protein
MPVSRHRLHYTDPPATADGNGHDELRVPQARVLRALMPAYPSDPPIEWPVVTRGQLNVRAGYSTAYGCSSAINRALHGIPAGSSSGAPHPGLLGLGLVEKIVFDAAWYGPDSWDGGPAETVYRITAAGIRAYQAYLAHGGKLPPVKDAATCTNGRYRLPQGGA